MGNPGGCWSAFYVGTPPSFDVGVFMDYKLPEAVLYLSNPTSMESALKSLTEQPYFVKTVTMQS